MPNINAPYGFAFTGRLAGGGNHPLVKQIEKAAATNARIRPGDIVGRANDGSLDRTYTPGTTLPYGVALNGGSPLTLTNHLVIVDWNAEFSAKTGATGFAVADRGLNCNAVLGSTSTRESDDLLNDGTEAVTDTLDFHLVELDKTVGNDYGAYSAWIVTFNKHRLVDGAAGV